jgi:hypothetical protein
MPNHTPDKPGSPLAPAESTAVTAHLNLLQAIITRLAGSSAQRKTWCVTIVSALFGLAGATKSGRIAGLSNRPDHRLRLCRRCLSRQRESLARPIQQLVARIRDGSYGLADFGHLSAPADAGHYNLGAVVVVGLAGLPRGKAGAVH